MKPQKFRALGIAITFVAASFGQEFTREAGGLPAGRFAKDLVEGTSETAATDVIVQYKEASGKRTRTVKVRRSELQRLAEDPDVEYVSPDREVRATANPPWEYMRALGYPYAGLLAPERPIYDGSGVGVAILDSGITSDTYFRGGFLCMGNRIVYSQNFVTTETTTSDLYGHGTHVAGIVGGNGDCLGLGTDAMSGVANGVNLINLRVLDKRGAGKDSYVIAAINKAIELKSKYNIRVINLSLGRPIMESYKTDPLCQAVEKAWKAGIVVVVAAGNAGRDNSKLTRGYGTIGSPANDPYIITVGATRMLGASGPGDDVLASYSSKGPTQIDHIVKPDLVAPGNLIASRMDPSQYLVTSYVANYVSVQFLFTNVGNVFMLSGTSMASPMVSGAAALLIDQDSRLNPSQVKAKLMKTAYKKMVPSATYTDTKTKVSYSVNHDLFSVGAGYLDIRTALDRWWEDPPADRVALSPWAQSVNGKLTVRYDYPNTASSLVWGDSLVWGESLVWGDAVVKNNIPLGGSSLVWGDATNKSYSLVWGDNLIWGDGSLKIFDESVKVQGDR